MKIRGGTYYRLREVQALTEESRHLINFLIRERNIPLTVIGRTKLVDEDGLRQLKNALAEYHGKPEAVSA